MGLNISLFVHGVPMGQKIWGPAGDDQRYISSFYGPKWDAPEVMKVEVMTFGGVTNCYYSFVKGQNVCDSQGRAGAYFALTLRINAFYADVQNMYNILKAAYEKMCVGLCVQDTGATVKHLVTDFQSIDSKLKDIEKHIINYISEFSINEDIVALSGFTANSPGASMNVNLHECTKRVALDCMKKQGKIMVSPYYLSVSAAKTVDKYKAEMEVTKQKAQQEIQLQQRTSQERIETITQQSQAQVATITQQAEEKLRVGEERSRQRIAQANEENERKMLQLRQNYADVDEKINTLHQKNRGLESEVSAWKKQYQQKEKELLSSNAKIQKLQDSVEQLQRDFSSLKGSGINQRQYNSSSKSVAQKNLIIVCIVSFFVIVLIGLLIYWLMGKWGDKKNKEVVHQELVEKKQQKAQTHNENTNNGKSPQTFNISIKEEDKEVKEIECGHTYVITLDGKGADTLKGNFNGAAFNISGSNHLMANRDSAGKTCTISYVLNGKVIATKSIKIEKD